MVQLQRLAGEYIKFFGPLMAGYAMASVPVIVLFVFSMRLFVKGMTEGPSRGEETARFSAITGCSHGAGIPDASEDQERGFRCFSAPRIAPGPGSR